MSNRCSVWILGDQLLDDHPALAAAEREFGKGGMRVLMVESRKRLLRHPYHPRKLVLLLSAMRHYAIELETKGYQVDYFKTETAMAGLREHLVNYSPSRLFTMAASEYRGRQLQSTLQDELHGVEVRILDNTQFLTGRYNPIPDPEPGKRYVMENFYRAMRRHFNLLMDGEQPAGGAWNFDKENRKALPKNLIPPDFPVFDPDHITEGAIEEVMGMEFVHPASSLGKFNLAVTREEAEQALNDFVANRLSKFGPYEDAMSQSYPVLFHSVLSPYLNLGLLDPLELARRAELAYRNGFAPVNSAEGFIRQVIGWREYIYWQYLRLMPGYLLHNFWQAERPVPRMFWDGATDMNCLRIVIDRINRTGYVHHIERLMILSNFFLLAQMDPLAVNGWFLSKFIDAYEWVMAPNVIGMGLYADGGLTATKPYIASANYIQKMGDFCKSCRYHPKVRTGRLACPFNLLYWNFLIEHEHILRKNPRMGRNVLGLRHLDPEERERVKRGSADFLDALE